MHIKNNINAQINNNKRKYNKDTNTNKLILNYTSANNFAQSNKLFVINNNLFIINISLTIELKLTCFIL